MATRVLTINAGSSSIRFALYDSGEQSQLILSGKIDRIGAEEATFRVNGAEINPAINSTFPAEDHDAAASYLFQWLNQNVDMNALAAIGHRIVHGGPKYSQSQVVTPELIEDLKLISPLDPTHLPQEIRLIELFSRKLPNRLQVACFDTAFHHDLPRVAQLLPIPRHYEAKGIRRYGFHGLSYAFLLDELTRIAGVETANGRVIFAHLGAGASLAAVHGGRCIDTTMALTPTSGLVMATRSGDLDPGLLVYLIRNEQLTADQVDALINQQSGLLGISETSSDMRDLLNREPNDIRAADAVEIFCYQARKWIGSLAAALEGIDTLVFSGGIGENSSEVRDRICGGLQFLGIQLDKNLNANNSDVISTDGSPVQVRVIRTDEELMIVRDVRKILDHFPS